jgi:hypothetical protein
MALIAQALTTTKAVRLYLGLYTFTDVTYETLTADTASITYSFLYQNIAPNTISNVNEISGTASDTISTALMTYDLVNGTITFSAARTGAITVGAYSYFAWDYSKDVFIERLINSTSNMVSKYCGRYFIAETYDEFYTGLASPTLILNQFPVNYISSVKVNSSSYTAGTDYLTAVSTYLDRGLLVRESGWPWDGYLTGLVGEQTAPIKNIEVVYSAGYTLEPELSRTLPYDIEDAVISIVADLYGEQQDGTVGLKRLTQGKLTYEWATGSKTDQYSSVLDKYKKQVI